jgi:hypothetical protein
LNKKPKIFSIYCVNGFNVILIETFSVFFNFFMLPKNNDQSQEDLAKINYKTSKKM